jgi:hypothetical protein
MDFYEKNTFESDVFCCQSIRIVRVNVLEGLNAYHSWLIGFPFASLSA